MDEDTAKIISIVCLWVGTWFFTCAPYFLVAHGTSNPDHVRIRDLIISYLKCFAGGVFMAACFLNIIPSGMHSMEKYFVMIGVDTEFPAYMCIAALGFFIIAGVELLAHALLHGAEGGHTHNHDDNQTHHHHLRYNDVDNTIPGITVLSHNPNSHGNGVISNDANKDSPVSSSSSYSKLSSIEMTEISRKYEQSENGRVGRESERPAHKIVEPEHNHDAAMLSVMEANPLRAFLLLAALSFHTIFDGLAIGLETTESGVWQMFTAIMIHKSLVSICLGLQLFLKYKDRPLIGVVWSLFFSIIAPICIGIGMALTSSDIDETAQLLTNTFLQGLAAGTFVFVTFFEILKEEIVDKKGFKRLFLVALGFVAMGCIKYFT